jgi:alpha-glucosidase
LSVNGESLTYSKKKGTPGWRFEGNTLTTVITTRAFRVAEAVTVKVRIQAEMARHRAMLDGFAGNMARLRETYDILNAAWPAGWSPDPVIDAMQTGDRISYHPETTFAEVSSLPAKLAGLAKGIDAMHATETSPAFAMKNPQKNHPSLSLEEYNRLVDTALAHFADLSETQPGLRSARTSTN